jgi:hypothetical protein
LKILVYSSHYRELYPPTLLAEYLFQMSKFEEVRQVAHRAAEEKRLREEEADRINEEFQYQRWLSLRETERRNSSDAPVETKKNLELTCEKEDAKEERDEQLPSDALAENSPTTHQEGYREIPDECILAESENSVKEESEKEPNQLALSNAIVETQHNDALEWRRRLLNLRQCRRKISLRI